MASPERGPGAPLARRSASCARRALSWLRAALLHAGWLSTALREVRERPELGCAVSQLCKHHFKTHSFPVCLQLGEGFKDFIFFS